MTSQQNLTTVQGYIVALPKQGGKEDAKVAVLGENGVEYRFLPKGMGIDLVDHINVGVEVTGVVQEKDELLLIHVRQYKIQDEYEDEWYDDGN